MSKKKFSIPGDLATGIKNSVDTGSKNRGQLHYDLMDINVIEPDPNNPRKLILTKEDIKAGLVQSDSQYESKHKVYESLFHLADSIKRVGVRNAIEVYKDEMGYRIISGERRFLASLMAGKTHVPVKINVKPDEFKLRYLQWIENIHREDLSLWEKYTNLKQLLDAYKRLNDNEIEVDKVSELLSVSTTQAYKYLSLLQAKDNILNLIKIGKISSLKTYYDIIQIHNIALRDEIIKNIAENSTNISDKNLIKSLIQNEKLKTASPLVNEGRGRPSNQIRVGKINNIKTAKKLIELIINHESLSQHRFYFSNIDWASPKSINQAFKNLINIVEKIAS